MDNKQIYINCLAYQIGLAKRKVTDYYNKTLRPYDLSPAYVFVLSILKDDGPCSLTHIATMLQLERATVSTLLGRMERDGFILRSTGNERRTLKVELAEKGIAVINSAFDALVEADKELNEKLDGKLNEIKELMNQINLSL